MAGSGRERGSREKEKGHCAWEAGTEARVPGGRAGLLAAQRLQGRSLSPGDPRAEAVSELGCAPTLQGPAQPTEHGEKGMGESEKQKEEGVSLIDGILHHVFLLSSYLRSTWFFSTAFPARAWRMCYYILKCPILVRKHSSGLRKPGKRKTKNSSFLVQCFAR